MSPLRWFRRHATWMLIIFGVVLMAIFGLGPVFDQMAQGFQSSGAGMEDPTIIKYRGGEVTRSKLDELARNHYATRRFLTALTEQAAKQCEEKDVQYRPLARMVSGLGGSNDNDFVDEQLLVRKLLGEKAEDEGVVISDGMIDDYLSLMAGQAEFSAQDWKQINNVVNQRTGMPRIRQHLKLELLAMQMQRYTSVAVPLNPIPTEAVELYARANNLIDCEVVPVSVKEYVDKVSGDPSPAETKALYAEGKYEYADIGMQKPGFKIPRKVNVQYFVADFKSFLESEKSKITDAEIETEYNRLVETEDPMVVAVVPQAEPEGFKMDLGEDDGEESSDEKPDDAKPDDAEPKSTDEKSDDETPALELEDENKADDSSEKDADDSTAETEKKDDVSLLVNSKKNQRVSLPQEEAADQEKAETESSEGDQEEKSNSEEEVGGLGDLNLSSESAGPATDDSKKTEIKPLTEVAEQIREKLARKTAFEKKDEQKKRAMLAMQTYQNQVLRWETQRESEKANSTKPEVPDFEKMAAEYGLAFRETGLVDPFELRETEIGKVNYPVQVQSPQGPVRMDFQSISNRIFADYDRMDLLIPQEVSDIMTGDAYVFWLSEKIEVRIPEIDEALPKIKEYWKYQQAVELAKKEAEKMASKANAEGKKLTELYPETAAPTGEFSWFSPGGGSMAAYGRPFGIDGAGEEFMETAFSLKEGEAGVAANAPRDTVYVIQRTTPSKTIADIGEEYLEKQYFRFKRVPPDVIGASQHYAQELEFDWRDDFVKSMELKRMK